ncbi:MAG: rRNA maturation RNase YbeY [Bacilli bacterium]|nr:rRNA maturation RNase YbeY [Bacilli bacterium]
MNEIGIFNKTEEIVDLEALRKLMEYALEVEKTKAVVFNIILIDNQNIHKMNLEYRGIDRPTDVISFALEDDKVFLNVEGIPRILGDIYISIEKAKEQAELYGHSFTRELSFLAVHGLLHLLGYDHMEKEDEKVMFDRQELILDGFGIKR